MEKLNKTRHLKEKVGLLLAIFALVACAPPSAANASQTRTFDATWNCPGVSTQLNFNFENLNIKLNKQVMNELLTPHCTSKKTPTALLIDFNYNTPAWWDETDGFDYAERAFGLLDNISPTTSPANITGYKIEVKGIKDYLKDHGEIVLGCGEFNDPNCQIHLYDFETALNVITFHNLAGHALSYENGMTVQEASNTEEEAQAYRLTKIYYDELMNSGKKLLTCSGSCANP